MGVDYRRVMGVGELARRASDGFGVKVAILDSGTPPAYAGRAKPPPSAADIDEFGHATEISSMLLGWDDITGICSLIRPHYVKVLDSRGFGSSKTVSRGIRKAIDDGVDVINLSLGFKKTEKCPKNLEKACQAALDAGISVVCAAGNDGMASNWPAALETTICVGSTDENGLKSPFSSFGRVDFVAPGVKLPVIGLDGRKKFAFGTSYSAALVSGVAALVIAFLRRQHQRVTPERVKHELRSLAQDIGAPGYDDDTGFGLIGAASPDLTVDMQPKGFFDIIFDRIKAVLGLGQKGAT